MTIVGLGPVGWVTEGSVCYETKAHGGQAHKRRGRGYQH